MTPADLMAAMEATWPPAEIVEADGWRLRRGLGGGKRVSAASPSRRGADIAVAEGAMRAWRQSPTFQITRADEDLDDRLSARRYQIIDRTQILVGDAASMVDDRPETARVLRGDIRVALMEEIWAAGGIGPERLAVMDRAKGPKTFLCGRLGDRPAGVAFVAAAGDVAMVHALETADPYRRRGVGRMLMAAAAGFAVDVGAASIALAVTEANEPANALYRTMGMTVAARYHYRVVAPD